MKKLVRNFLLTMAFLSVASLCSGSFAEVVDKVIAVVNDEVITQREFDRAFNPIKEGYEANFKGEELEERLKEAKKQLLDMLVNSKLTISLAKAQKVKIDEAELERRIDKIRSFYSTEDEFLRALNAKGTNLSEFEKELGDQMLAQKLVEKEVASKIVITPGEIRDLYDKNREKLVLPPRVKARGIMIRKTGEPGEKEARKKIERIVSDLKKGRNFKELAREKSEGPYAGSGGDMGYISQGQMVGEIDKVVFSMKKGQVSDIVETNIGFHLFLIEDIEEKKLAELAEVSDFLREQLFRRKFEENLVKWLEEKKKNAYISYK